MLRNCDSCGSEYDAKRPTSRFCSGTCQKRHRRARGPVPGEESAPAVRALPSPEDRSPEAGLSAATQKRLADAGRLDSYEGQSALSLAQRIEFRSTMDTGSAYAALHRELRAAMAEALKGSAEPKSALARHRDELAARRQRRA